MPSAPELRTVASRSDVMGLLRRHADLRSCDVALYDSDGASIDTPERFGGARPGSNGRSQSPLGAASEPVTIFDRVVGWIIAAPRDVPLPRDTPGPEREVARRGAALLSDLCCREYELNDLSREILGAYEELNLFYDLSAELAVATDAEAVCRVVVAKAARVINVERAWLLLNDPKSGTLRPAAAHKPPPGDGAIGREEGAAGRVLATRSSDLIEEVASHKPAGESHDQEPLAGWETAARKSLVTVPVHIPGRDGLAAVGVLQLVDRVDGAPFSAGDVKLASALANHAAVLVENQRLITYEKELKIARTIQQSLLPAAPPTVPGLDVAGACLPASNVGGDYYDHFAVGTASVGVIVADVSGHNLAAALLQTAARSTFRSEVLAGGSPAQVLRRTARTLFDDLTRADLFLTAAYCTVDGVSGRAVISDAGHHPTLLYRATDGSVTPILCTGVPIGVMPDAEYDEQCLVLAPGDVLLAYTDGISEARPSASDGADRGSYEEYGEARLSRAFQAAAAGSAREIVDAVLADVARFAGGRPAADDRSLVVVKMRGGDSR